MNYSIQIIIVAMVANFNGSIAHLIGETEHHFIEFSAYFFLSFLFLILLNSFCFRPFFYGKCQIISP